MKALVDDQVPAGQTIDLRRVNNTSHTTSAVSRSGAVEPDWVGVGDVNSVTVTDVLEAGVEWAAGRLASRV